MRRLSKPLSIGGVTIGGGAPIVIQSMTKTDTRDIRATLNQISELKEVGCKLVRVAIPDMEAADAFAEIKKKSSLPLIADIHFDYRLALAALDGDADSVRINPGNIGDRERVAQIVRKAKERKVPIRIGINAGSLPKDLISTTLPQRMVEACLKEIDFFESLDFDLIKISLKAFDVPATIEANRLIAQKTNYPIHLGITEAGPGERGVIRSAVGIGILLYEGIGDTIRVSLTAHPREEVIAGYEILKSLDLESHGPVLISCPTCGRCEVNLLPLVKEVEARLSRIDKPLKVAVMGCLPAGEQVIGEQGPVSIERLKEGEFVLGSSGRFMKVLRTTEHFYEGEVIEITPRGAPSFRLTPGHPLLALRCGVCRYHRDGKPEWEAVANTLRRGESPAWIPAGELTRDYLLLYPIIQGEQDTSYVSADGWRPVLVDELFMMLSAYYIAEGSCSGKNGIPYQIHFSFGSFKDRELAVHLQNILSNYGVYSFTRERHNELDVITSSKPLGTMLVELFGRGATHKHLPSWMLMLPKEKQRILIKTLWQCDGYIGHVGGYWRACYTTASFTLAIQVHQLLLRLGVPAYLMRLPKGWSVVVSSKAALKTLFELLELPQAEEINHVRRETLYLDLDGRYLYLPVFRIRRVPYKGFVYNLEVAEDQSYSAPGAVLHNCEVNGPGEAREADIGIACGKGRGALFVKGKVVKTVKEGELLQELLAEIEKLSTSPIF